MITINILDPYVSIIVSVRINRYKRVLFKVYNDLPVMIYDLDCLMLVRNKNYNVV